MNPTHAILLTLLVPGAAHFLLGKAVRGVVALVVTAGMFFAGYALLQDRLFHAVLFQPFTFRWHARVGDAGEKPSLTRWLRKRRKL